MLHYYHECKGSESFRRDYGVTHSDNVFFGGIIIGSRDRLSKGDYESAKKNRLIETALMIRKKYIYDPASISIMHWDYILDQLLPRTELQQHPVEETEINNKMVEPVSLSLESS